MDRIQLIFKAVFAVWVALWVIFAARDIFFKANFTDYKALILRSPDGKRSYVTGDDLYRFIEFCRKVTPEKSSYRIEGIKEGEIERVRAVYYLYPRTESVDYEYIFVYKSPMFAREGYALYKKLDDGRFILKKAPGKRS